MFSLKISRMTYLYTARFINANYMRTCLILFSYTPILFLVYFIALVHLSYIKHCQTQKRHLDLFALKGGEQGGRLLPNVNTLMNCICLRLLQHKTLLKDKFVLLFS